jgi:hypothetical protein
MNDNTLANLSNNMGIEIFEIYQSSCYSDALPHFTEIYQQYQLDIWSRNTNKTTEYVENQLMLLKQKIYTFERINIPQIEICSELVLFDHLLQHNYSFIKEEKIYKSPIIGVW